MLFNRIEYFPSLLNRIKKGHTLSATYFFLYPASIMLIETIDPTTYKIQLYQCCCNPTCCQVQPNRIKPHVFNNHDLLMNVPLNVSLNTSFHSFQVNAFNFFHISFPPFGKEKNRNGDISVSHFITIKDNAQGWNRTSMTTSRLTHFLVCSYQVCTPGHDSG